VQTTGDAGMHTATDGQVFFVRPSRPTDARPFLEMWQEVVGERRFVRTETVTTSARYWRKRFRDSWTNDHASLVALHGDRMIGNLDVAREEGTVTRHVASIGMAVARDWRGRGVGSALLAEAVRWAEHAGVEKLGLSVYPDNERARALYRKFGFEEEGRLTGHSKKSVGYLDEIVMGRWVIDRPPGVGPALGAV
jgi:L-phenylalanine/L-methionine N-acetyltransferase